MKAVFDLIRRHDLLHPGMTVIVAVSGGPDSIALLDFLWKEKRRFSIDVRACHLNHMLRGAEADEDAAFVRTFCKEREIVLYENEIDVNAYAKEMKIGTQLAARTLRYEWFNELLKQHPNSCIATAHHGDDQVETMLMKMIRGAFPFYSFGIPVKRKLEYGVVIRPFLAITKEDIEAYCKRHELSYRQDSSNQSKAYTRNRIRQELLPIIKKENEHVHLHMQRQNEWWSDDQTYLMEEAKRLLPSIIKEKSDQIVTISRTAFLSKALPLQRRLVHLILNCLCENDRSITTSSIHIDQVLALLHRDHPSAECHLSDRLYVRRAYDDCHFFIRKNEERIEHERTLLIPGETSFYDWTLRTSFTDRDVKESDDDIVLDYDAVALPLYVRSRRANDRIQCRGMAGTKKVSRLFIDRKVPKHERSSWPLVVDANGEVLWVPLLHRSKIGSVNERTKRKLIITCSRNERF